jgi:DNA mismatch repair protein MutS2
MQHTSGDILEFAALKAVIGRYVASEQGKALLDAVQPSVERAEIEASLADLGEALEYLRTAAQPQVASRGAAVRLRFRDLPDTRLSLATLRIEGATLEGRQIWELSELLDRAGEARAILLAAGERFPRLARKVAGLEDLRAVVRGIAGKILPDGSVADDASVALNRLRREIERQQKQIQASLERFLKAHHNDGTLQEDFVTIRNDRFVVPIVAGKQRRVEGVIHGASGSGHTMFVEPIETIQLNNELVRLREEEMREVHRILREITAHLRAHATAIARAAEAMGELDLLFGKAEFGREWDCTVPRLSAEESRTLLLREARHPLLQDVLKRQGKTVVPISLRLDRESRTLLISGPNTGGKTVSLKTAGLLALMTHAGFPVPAVEAEFPVFDCVLADIGDMQSIEQSLSSFSAHIATVREMLREATPDSLILLDELGRATDPEEGGALGVAILDRFCRLGCFTLASTHLLALKVYGANTPGVVNASMGFDEQTFQPTFVLRLGAPGKSAGLDIATRLGLWPELIERARSAMSSSERDIFRFLSELHARLESTAAVEQELAQKQAELEERERSLARDFERKYQARVREIEEKTAELTRQFEEQARRTIEEITASVESRKAVEQAQRKVARTRREFQENVAQQTAAARPGGEPPKLQLTEGARVRLRGIRQPARVRRITGDVVEVDAGLMKMQVSVDDIEEVLPPAEGARLPQGVTFTQGPRWDASYREINLIGKRSEEAMDEVDKFLDSAALAQVDRVRIVHGHGMGILKRAVADLLARSPHVEKFYPASQGEGGEGATVVELKQ